GPARPPAPSRWPDRSGASSALDGAPRRASPRPWPRSGRPARRARPRPPPRPARPAGSALPRPARDPPPAPRGRRRARAPRARPSPPSDRARPPRRARSRARSTAELVREALEEAFVLLGGADRHPQVGRHAEAAERPGDDAVAEQPLLQAIRVRADLD